MEKLQRIFNWRKFCRPIFAVLILNPLTVYASFIEATIGTAVVNDATATFYNPAALTLLKNPQIITLDSVAYFHTQFTGQTVQSSTGFFQSGSSKTETHYYLPSLYLGVPVNDKLIFGIAAVTNFFNRDLEANSIVRYAQSGNSIQDIDLVPAVGIKLNDFFSIGAGLNFSYANFLLQPVTGFPSSNSPDSQSRNQSSGTSVGGDIGFLLKPSKSTLIGFNYRGAITYLLNGKSVFEGIPEITSNDYHFKFWSPARSVLSLNQFLTPKLGMIGTVQFIQTSVLKDIKIYGIATQVNSQPVIIPKANVPFHLNNVWLFTLGSYYKVTSKWVIRVAGSYNQSSGNPHYQISNGDGFILGGSTGYEICKNILIDGSYAHAFIRNQTIDITTGRNLVSGVNKSFRDAFSLKLTFNI